MSNGDPDEPDGPSADPEPDAPSVNLALDRVPFDADLGAKAAWALDGVQLPEVRLGQTVEDGTPDESQGVGRVSSLFDFVEPPPRLASTAPGSRDPRHAADVAGLDPGARHNWVPRGPRNVGGRVSALAVHPTDPRIMLAGAASGGVHRTTDGGETWQPIPFWNSLPSLAIGAIGFCRGHPQTIYVATGENATGGGEVIPGNGVYRSDDGGDHWVNDSTSVPPVPGAAPHQAFSFEALAVHPTVPAHCWAVGAEGVFRTLNGGRDWTAFEAGVRYSDAVFSVNAAGQAILYLVRADARGAFVIRLDNPSGDGQPAISAAAHRTRVLAAPVAAPPAPGALQVPPDGLFRAKIAIAASRPDVAYVRVVTEGGTDCDGRGAGGRHAGVFRTRNARNTPVSGVAWVRLQDHFDWPCERQGGYNLTLAVDPTDHNCVATAMVDLYVTRNGNATAAGVRWLRAMAWELYVLDRGHHADHHAALFAPQPAAAPGTPPALWVANDGGISRSVDWKTGSGYPQVRQEPLGHGNPPIVRPGISLPIQGVDGNGNPVAQAPISWRKRSHGIVAAQMYDVTQSPLVPTLYGCGFQDNGVFVTAGSESWHFALGADGGFVAFDPDDPYRFVATWQGGAAKIEYTGRLDGTFPVPGDPVVVGTWPRVLFLGLGAQDGADFVAATAFHPRKSGRILHARVNRLYGQPAQGETWQPLPVGGAVEIGLVSQPQLQVFASPGAAALGIPPQVSAAPIVSAAEPFAFAAGDRLHMAIEGTACDVVFNPGLQIANLAAATAVEVLAYITANARNLPTVLPRVVGPPGARAVQLSILSRTVLEVVDSPAARKLGLVPQTTGATVRTRRSEPFALAAGDQLSLVADGNARTIVFNAGPAIPDLAHATAAQVARHIASTAPAAPPTVNAQPFFPSTGVTVEITTTAVGAGERITLGGSALAAGAGALPALGLLPGVYGGAPGRPASVTLGFPGFTRAEFVRNRNLANPAAGPPLELTVQVDAGPVRHVQFAPPAFPDPAWVRTGELAAALAAALAPDPVTVTTRTVRKSVRLAATSRDGVQTTGTACVRLNMPGTLDWSVDAQLWPFGDAFRNQNAGNFNSFDLSSTGAALRLVIADNANAAPPLVFNAAAGAANLRCVTAEELQRIISAHLQAIPAAARPKVTVELVEGAFVGSPRLVRYAESDPDTVWVSGDEGYLAVSNDDGGAWRPVGDLRFRLRDRYVSGLALDPRDRRKVIVGLAGHTTANGADPGFLFRTQDEGATWNPVAAGPVDAAGVPVGVNALELDPAAPDVAFAATDVGVYRSTDGGEHWAPFNEGLPNVVMRDLAFSPSLRTLRVGAWGRGIYDRYVGDRAPKDVQLFVRQNGLDDGSVRPAPDGLDPLATVPRATGADAPDIKVNRDRPPQIGADDLVDGVEFDEDIVHEEPVIGANQHANLFVQVHNRGAFPATALRLVALWADATNGPPPLPADFWAGYGAAGPLGPVAAPWHLIGDTRSDPGPAPSVQPGYPRVHTFHADWPETPDGMRTLGILLLVSSAEDVLAPTALDIATLLATETKIGYRETAVTSAADDATFFLAQTTAAQFTVTAPGAGTSAAPNLGIAPAALGAATDALRGGTEPFNLAPAPQALVVSTPPQTVTVPFLAPADIRNLATAGGGEVVGVLNRAFELAGMPARARIDAVPGPPRWALVLHGTGGATVAVVPIVAPGVDAAAALGLAAGAPASTVVGGTAPFNLPVGSALQVTATNSATLQLAAADFADPAHATAHEVRRALNRDLAEAHLAVRAVVPKVDLRIRHSGSDADGAAARVADRRLANLVASSTQVAEADRPALFDFVALLRGSLLQAGHDDFLYVRTANLGDAAEPAVRHRVFRLAMSASPITCDPVGSVQAAVPAGGAGIVELPWNPGDIAAGERLFLLAIADVDADGRRLDPPVAGFPSIDDLEAFCDTHPNAACRELEVFV